MPSRTTCTQGPFGSPRRSAFSSHPAGPQACTVRKSMPKACIVTATNSSDSKSIIISSSSSSCIEHLIPHQMSLPAPPRQKLPAPQILLPPPPPLPPAATPYPHNKCPPPPPRHDLMGVWAFDA